MNSLGTLENRLPRLLYLADVPVEASHHGSLLIHRLLESYPKEKLLIVEPSTAPSNPSRRLPGVRYETFNVVGGDRLYKPMGRFFRSWILLTAKRRLAGVKQLAEEFRPEAVLTVTHGYSCLTAAAFARRAGLPLHLICHDDWFLHLPVFGFLLPAADRDFKQMYRAAGSRLCICPNMADYYAKRYGAPGSVLYPCRSRDYQMPAALPAKTGDKSGLIFAFAGNISNNCEQLIENLSAVARKSGGKVLMFGPASDKSERLQKSGAIVFRGLVPAEKIVETLRAEADCLYVPVPFEEEDRLFAEISFPSKIGDGTAVGIPLLLHAPEYSSAVRWARENPGTAEVVTRKSQEALELSIKRLQEDSAYRASLAACALAAGNASFSNQAALKVLYGALTKSSPK